MVSEGSTDADHVIIGMGIIRNYNGGLSGRSIASPK